MAPTAQGAISAARERARRGRRLIAVPRSPDPRRFDHFAVEYDFAASCWRDHRFFVERLPERRRAALDIGCGSGGLVEAIAPHFDHVRGVDLSEPLLEIARAKRARPNVEYVLGDAERLEGMTSPVAEGWDLIVTHTMLHHVRTPERLAARFASLLAPGGRLLVVDNVSWTEAIPRIVFLVSPWLSLPGHVRAHGWRDAWRLHRFALSKPWIDHLVSDRYFTEARFRARYGESLPGAKMQRDGVFMQLEWSAPSRSEVSA